MKLTRHAGIGSRRCRYPLLVCGCTIAFPFPCKSKVVTIHSIHALLVMFGVGLMSMSLESSFTILSSPFLVLLMRWMVAEPISSAIFRTHATISGILSRDV